MDRDRGAWPKAASAIPRRCCPTARCSSRGVVPAAIPGLVSWLPPPPRRAVRPGQRGSGSPLREHGYGHRIFHTATLLSDGIVLVVDDGLHVQAPASAELYDSGSGRWTAMASPAVTRVGYAATLLRDGRVLVTGDYDYEPAAPTELYDPGTQP